MENYIDEITGLLALELSNIDADHERLIELLEKSERTFRDEHLSRFDEGKPVPPDVQDLKRHMKAWIKMYPNNGYIENIWNGEEWNEYDQIASLLKSWLNMIDSYYPVPQIEKNIVPEYTRNHNEEPQQEPLEPKPEPQQAGESNKQGKRGRPSPINFFDVILSENKDEVLKKLHREADGKSGKDFVLVMLAAIEIKMIKKPTFKQVKAEFPSMGGKSNYYVFLNKNNITDKEINGAIDSLKC